MNSEKYNFHEYLDYHIVDIFFLVIIIFLCVYIYTLYGQKDYNENKLNNDIDKLNKNIKNNEQKSEKQDNCPIFPTIADIKQSIFADKGISFTNGNTIYAPYNLYNSDYDQIHKGSDILNTPVNTENSEYIINKQNIMMDKIKLKLKQYADDNVDDGVKMFVENENDNDQDENDKS